ncbi:MAG TPA: MFS transporter [Steroidobacteraceae bacterium]
MTVIAPALAAEGSLRQLSYRQRIRAILAGSAGNLIEWYDFYAYAFMALYFAPSFFPEGDRTAQLLNAAGIFAAGFLIRPIGAWFFGRYADRHGRRAAMIASILMIGAGSLVIGLLPTYEAIGAWAPALLLVARLVQGFSTGGQYGPAATYLSEAAIAGRRGFFASFQYVTIMAGQLSAIGMLFVLQQILSGEAIRDWAWRIPFFVGAALAASVLLFRRAMHETVSEQARKPESGSLRGLVRHPLAILVVMSISSGGAIVLYTFTTYMQNFLVNTAGMNIEVVSVVMISAMVTFMVLQPVFGALSDWLGRRNCLLLFGGLMTFAAVPLLSALETVSSPFQAFLLIVTALTILSFYSSISGLFKSELFPVHIRALGVGLAHNVAAAVFGGSAAYVALFLKRAGHESWFYWYVAAVCFAAFIGAILINRLSRDRSLA